MYPFEDFRQQLQHVLLHLNDPDYAVPPGFSEIVMCDGTSTPGLMAVQSAIIEAIRAVKPDQNQPLGSRAEYLYQILDQRFILGRTQEQAAESLDLSIRSLQRLQREASHILARHLWARFQATSHATGAKPAEEREKNDPGQEWSSQLQRELTLLQNQTPDAECMLDEIITRAIHIVQARTKKKLNIHFLDEQFKIRVKFQPSILHQVFVSLLGDLTNAMPDGKIDFTIRPDHDRMVVMLQAAPFDHRATPEYQLQNEMLESQAGTLETRHVGEALTVTIGLRMAGGKRPIRVLVVDDNVSLVSLYQSYCIGTPYQLFHLRDGRRILEEVHSIQPDVILLDILLPDIDGWDLLIDLHANLETNPIPIIVCSVVTDEQLVRDLGAALYLRKPIWRQQLLDAIESVLSPDR